ncbi:MAG: thiamine-phosphate kinase [Verrucomicrobiota bacterium]
MKTLVQVGEDELVRLITAGLETDASVLLGPGDDCAVVRGPTKSEALVLKTDTIVEGVHFTAETSPRLIGRKAMARVLSDFAAMAATPRHALVTLIAPPETPVKRVLEIYQGMRRIAEEFSVRIVGGETSSGRQLILSISMSGSVPNLKWITRGKARAGDRLYVTGRLGGSIRGKHLKFQPRLKEAQCLTRCLKVTAMMDLSDGLAKDLPRLARRSGLGYELVAENIPLNRGCTLEQALNDGEDYELLFSVPARTSEEQLQACMKDCRDLKLYCIGELVPLKKQRQSLLGGWDHFQP